MQEARDFEKCVSILNQEIALVRKISFVQNSVCQAVMAREWVDFNWKMAEINQLGSDFYLLETERMEIFNEFCKKEKINLPDKNMTEFSFHDLTSKLPPEESRILSGLFRDLKMETLNLKTQNNTFTGYLNEIKTISAALLDVFLPVVGGKLYNQKGVQAAGDLRSMVLNRHI